MSARDEIEAEIRAQLVAEDSIKNYLDKFAVEVRDYWRSVSPVKTGRYAASVQVFKKPIYVEGMPGRRVGATSNRAHLIEYGTGSDTKGDDPRYVPRLGVQIGRDTPTPAYAPRAKTAAHFGGNEARVKAVVQDQNLEVALGETGQMSQEQRISALKEFNAVIVPLGGNE